MIKINLAVRKQAVGVGLGELQDVKASAAEMLSGLPIRTIALAAMVIFGGNMLLDGTKDEMMKKLDVRGQQATEANNKLRAELEKTKELEATKKTLDEYESVIRTKIEVIKKLIDGRQNPPKMLLAISSDIPQAAWISELEVTDENVRIVGMASGYVQITDFMKSLAESAYFGDFTPNDSQTAKDELGLENTSFSLTAKRR